MVKSLRLRKYQDLRVPGLLWVMIGLPRGANGVALKLKEPLILSQAEISGAIWIGGVDLA